MILTFSLNSLGLDRAGLQMLFLFPVRPLDILFGKNLFTGSLSFVILVALTCARAALGSGWDYVPLAIAVGTAAIFVMLACGNVTSVISPFRMRQMRTGDTSTIARARNGRTALLHVGQNGSAPRGKSMMSWRSALSQWPKLVHW